MTNIQINNRYAGAVIRSCDRHFTGLVPNREDEDGKDNNLYTHLFRAVYATIAAHWFCPPRLPEGEFKAYIQGHFQITDENDPTLRNNIASGRHYSDYAIGDGLGNRDGRLGIRLGEPDVVVVEAFRSFYRSALPEKTGDAVEESGSEGIRESSEKRTATSTDERASKATDTDVTARSGKSEEKKSPRSSKSGPVKKEARAIDTDTNGGANSAAGAATVPDVREVLGWMLNSRQYTVLLVGLMTVTGKSPGELIKSGLFKLSDDRSTLTFSPTSVTRSSPPLPTLLSPDVTIGAIDRLREHPKVKELQYFSPDDIDTRALQRIGRALRLYLPFKNVGELFEYYRSEVARAADGTAPPIDTSPRKIAPSTNASEPPVPEVPDRGVAFEAAKTEPDSVGTSDTNALRWAGVARSIARSLGIDDPDSFRSWIEKQLPPDTDTSPATGDGTSASKPARQRRAGGERSPTVEPGPIPDEPDFPIVLENASPTSDSPEPVTGEAKPETEEPMTLETMFLAQQRSIDQLTGAIFQLVDSLASSRPGRGSTRSLSRDRTPSDHSRTTDATGTGDTTAPDTTGKRASSNFPDFPSEAKNNARKATSPGRPGNEALVNRAIDAILHYNDSIASTKKDKWLISWSALKQLTKCNQEVIARVLERRKDEIDHHHEEHELGTFHNSVLRDLLC